MIFEGKGVNDIDIKEFDDNINLINKGLYLYIFNMTRNKDLAEDAMQNTLFTAYKNYSTLNDKGKFKSWIFTIAKRETMALVKKCSREMPSEEGILGVINKEQTFLLPEEKILQNELTDYVVQAINQLTPKLRVVIVLYYYENFSFKEIEKMLNVKRGTLKLRHMRAKEAIYIYLDKNYYNKKDIKIS